ncbi:hypothetical protein O181_041960 [Austropuccinia psidii MF-1]|uniref:DUF6534 domain-containing protein n=1 Tax=Austropuccinia psidii MF-1 TaxID=1389203 RepID=A0A9Q3DFT8_9BASI|nr:hypothetical protein [Austropuccinia psidii MF-1]
MLLAPVLEELTTPFIVGTAFSTFLFGITLAQTYTYFTTFRKDQPVYRWAVIGLLVVDILQTICCEITLWLWFVVDYGATTSALRFPWSFALSPLLCGIATFVVQLFYAYRIYLLANGNRILPLLIAFGSLLQFAWAVGATAQAFMKPFSSFHIWSYGVVLWLGGAAAVDLVITISLLLIFKKSKKGFQKTNNLLDRLIALTVKTNGITFTVAVLDLIFFSMFNNASHAAPNLCLVKLYFNSLLVSLNSRESLAENFGGSKTIHPIRQQEHNPAQKVTFAGLEAKSPDFYDIEKDDKSNGVYVYTTASLTTDHVKVTECQNELRRFSMGGMRADRNNGFTTNIVGGYKEKTIA